MEFGLVIDALMERMRNAFSMHPTSIDELTRALHYGL